MNALRLLWRVVAGIAADVAGTSPAAVDERRGGAGDDPRASKQVQAPADLERGDV